eukprot:3568601-Rhodomonas_salina.1
MHISADLALRILLDVPPLSLERHALVLLHPRPHPRPKTQDPRPKQNTRREHIKHSASTHPPQPFPDASATERARDLGALQILDSLLELRALLAPLRGRLLLLPQRLSPRRPQLVLRLVQLRPHPAVLPLPHLPARALVSACKCVGKCVGKCVEMRVEVQPSVFKGVGSTVRARVFASRTQRSRAVSSVRERVRVCMVRVLVCWHRFTRERARRAGEEGMRPAAAALSARAPPSPVPTHPRTLVIALLSASGARALSLSLSPLFRCLSASLSHCLLSSLPPLPPSVCL